MLKDLTAYADGVSAADMPKAIENAQALSSNANQAQALAILTCVRQASADSFAENLPFELGKNGQQGRHGATSRRGQIQRFGQ